MRSADLLANIRVASPCLARWADMAGDDRTRFCAQCQKHVYNLSEMTAEAASNLIRENDGKLCVRFYRRSDGTILTSDCPVGAAAIWRRTKRLTAATVALLCSSLAAGLWASNSGQGGERRTRPKVYQAWENALAAVWDFVNPKPPQAIPSSDFTVGGICPSLSDTDWPLIMPTLPHKDFPPKVTAEKPALTK